MKKKFDPTKHILVPQHKKLSEKDKKEFLAKYRITDKELPQIGIKDAALEGMDIKAGDVIKIIRSSPTAGESVFYRVVQNE